MKMRACEIFSPRIFFFCAHLLCVCSFCWAASSLAVDIDTCKQRWAPIEVWPIWPTATTIYPLSPSLSSISLSVVFKDIFQHTSFPIALFPLIHFPSPLLESALTTIYHLPLTNYRSLSSGLDSAWCLMLYDSSFSFFIFFPVHFELKTSLFCLSVCHHRAGV